MYIFSRYLGLEVVFVFIYLQDCTTESSLSLSLSHTTVIDCKAYGVHLQKAVSN